MSVRMILGVDARPLQEQRTGIGRYLENLLRELARQRPDWRYHLYTVGPPPDDSWIGAHPFVARPLGFEQAGQTDLFAVELASTPPDVFFSPLYELPDPIALPSVITVHDMVHEATPDAFNDVQLAYLRARHAYALRRADRIITDSAFARQDIERFVDRTDIAVIPLAADPRFTPGASREVPPYFLYVGSIARKRHVIELLEAFRGSASLRARNYRLVLVGQNYLPRPADLDEALRGAEDVLHRPYVRNGELLSLYRGARALVYLSSYEGFGMPPLEAMACGTPVLAADAASVPEVVGDAAWLVRDPRDVAGIRACLERLSGDDALHADLSRRGLLRARRFSWRETARRTIEVIESLRD